MTPRAAKTGTGPQALLLESLHELGFSQYEARCYVGLLNREPQTGYSVAKSTGVPQPKVYEALRKLVSRGAAYEVRGDPARFVPESPSRLLDKLETAVSGQLAAARQAAASLVEQDRPQVDLLSRMSGRTTVVAAASSLIADAKLRVYVSAGAAELADIEEPLRAAADGGADIVVLCFGQMPFDDTRFRVYRHASTDGTLFRHHQARHLAVIVDSRATVWGLAPGGHDWTAIQTDNDLVIAALKGFIRHDIDMQQVFADFGPDLVRQYGPGLEGLERYRQQPAVPAQTAAAAPARTQPAAAAPRTARTAHRGQGSQRAG